MFEAELGTFQLVAALFTIVINLYCIGAVVAIQKLRKLAYFLVILQTVVDLLSTGIYSALYNFFMMAVYAQSMCWESLVQHMYLYHDLMEDYFITQKPKSLHCFSLENLYFKIKDFFQI